MTTSILTSKNQTTIPKAVIKALGLAPSDQLVYEIEAEGRVILTAKTATFAGLAGSFRRKPAAEVHKVHTMEEMDAAIKKEAVKRLRM